VAGYALLGAAWLMMKTRGDVEQRARGMGMPLLAGLLFFIALVSIWTPLQIERIAARWFSFPNLILLAPVPVATAFFAWLCWHGIRTGRTVLPFVCAIAIFLLAFAGLVLSNIPYMVPASMTVWQAASHPSSQLFFLVGAAILLPMILAYTALVFWLFRGTVKEGEGYH